MKRVIPIQFNNKKNVDELLQHALAVPRTGGLEPDPVIRNSVVAQMSIARTRWVQYMACAGQCVSRALACLSGRFCDGDCSVCGFWHPQVAARSRDDTVSRVAGCCYGYEPDRFSQGFVFRFAFATRDYEYFSGFQPCG